MIIGRDLLTELGMIIDFNNRTMTWDHATISMETEDPRSKKRKTVAAANTFSQDKYPESVRMVSSRITTILDCEYAPADLPTIVDKIKYLNLNEKKDLSTVLNKYKSLFDGTLGNFNVEPVDLELKEGAKPVQLRAFSVPHSRRTMFKNELNRLIKLGVLDPRPYSLWASPSFLIPKSDDQCRFYLTSGN